MYHVSGIRIRTVGTGDERADFGLSVEFTLGFDRRLFVQSLQKAQVILLAGESGAGKLVAVVHVVGENIIDIHALLGINFDLRGFDKRAYGSTVAPLFQGVEHTAVPHIVAVYHDIVVGVVVVRKGAVRKNTAGT